MTTRRTHQLIWLLVSLFALRGLIPTGYMLNVSGGSLSIVMCGGDGPLKIAAPDPHAGHAGHEHHHEQGGGHDQHDKHSGSVCPFALTGSAAPTPTIISPPIAIAPIHGVDVAKVVPFHGLFGPSRAQQSRAPPLFS